MKAYINKTIAIVLILMTVLTTPGLLPAFADGIGFGAKTAEAAFNKQINYQGKLTNPGNVPVTDGVYHMRFALYTTATGGAPLWQEDRSTATGDRVTISNGLFSVMLGSSTPLAGLNFDQTLYLGVEVGGSAGGPTWDGEMSPRKILGAVPAAFVADTLDGLDSTQFVRTDATSTITTNSAQTSLTISQTGAGSIFNLQTGGNSAFTVANNGNVGIGSTSPYASLAVAGASGVVANLFVATSTTAVSSFQQLLANGSTTLQNFTALNATTSNATTTGAFAVTGNATSTFANGISIATGCFAINGTCLTTGSGSSASSTLLSDNNAFSGANIFNNITRSTTTQATTTSFAISGVLNALLKTNGSGSVVSATAGSDYEVPLTFNTGLTRSVNTITCDTASISTLGCLTAADFSIFNNKISSSSLDTSAKLASLLTDETGTAGSVVFSISPAFTGTPTFQGFLSQASTTISALTVTTGTTTNATSTNLFATNFVTSNFKLSGIGSNMVITSDASGNFVASSTPTVAAIIATSTTATSTFAGAVQVGTSTFPSGLFVVGTSSLGGLFYVDRNSGNIGIGSSSPYSRFSIVNPNATGIANLLEVDTAAGAPVFTVKNQASNIKVGVGTTTPSTEFGVTGSGYFTNAIGVGAANTTAGSISIDDSTNAVLTFNETTDTADLGTIQFRGAGTLRASITGRNDLTMGNTLNFGPLAATLMRLSGNGSVGIGTTSAQFLLQLATTSKPQLALTDTNALGTNWVFRNAGGLFALATSTNTVGSSATSTVSAFTIDANGVPAFASLGGVVGCAQFSSTGALSNTGSACGTNSGSSFPFTTTTFGATTANATNTLIGFTNGFYSLASSTISALTVTTGTTTNATSTNLFATNASTTNLFFGAAVGGAVTSNATGQFANLVALGSTTLQNFTGINATTTNATTTTLAVTGNATSTFANGIALSTGCFAIGSTCLTQGLTSALTSIGPTGQTTTGPAVTIATSTTGTDFTVTGSGSTLTFNLPFASATAHGKLASTDWSIFNNKISSSSLDTSAKLAALLTDETGTAGSVVFSISPNFTGTPTFQGFLSQASTTISALTVTTGTTTNATSTNFFANNASTTNLTFATAIGGTGQFINLLALGSTTLQNVTFTNATGTSATTTNFFATNASTTNLFFGAAVGGAVTSNATGQFANLVALGSTTLQNFTGINATTTNATTTTLAVTGNATSTFANGIALSTGCFAIGSTCLTQGLTSALTSIGPTGQTTTGPAVTIATSTTGTDFTVTGSGSTLTFNLPFASATAHGKLASTDWSIFNNKISSSSLDTSAKLAALLTDETGTGNAVFSILPTLQGFISTASSTIGDGLQTGGLTIFGGATTTGSAYISGSLGVGTAAPSATLDITGTGKFSSTVSLSSIASCTGSQALQTNGSGDISCGTIATGGATSGGGWTAVGGSVNGTVGLATTTYLVAVGATSTPYAKFTVLSGSSGTTTVALIPAASQTANILDIYNTAGNLSTVFTSAGFLGLGSTSPKTTLAVEGSSSLGNSATAGFFISTTTATSTFAGAVQVGTSTFPSGLFVVGTSSLGGLFYVDRNSGNIGIGSSSPYSRFSIVNPNLTGVANLLQIDSSLGTPVLSVKNNSNTGLIRIGVGTTTASTEFSVNGSGYFTNAIGVGVANTTAGTLAIDDGTNAVINLNETNDNADLGTIFFKGAGTTRGSITGRNDLTMSSTLNLGPGVNTTMRISANGTTGIGTTSAQFLLTLATTSKPQLALTDSGNLAGNNWVFRNAGGLFALATSTNTINTSATSTVSAFTIDANGVPAFASLGGVAGCAQFSSTGALSNTGTVCGSGSSAFPFTTTTFGATTANATNTLIGFTNGFYSLASSTISALTVTTGTTTNATSTNFFANNASTTNLTFATAIGGTGQFINLLALGSTTLQNVTFTNATGTSATTTNFFATNASTTNLFFGAAVGGAVTSNATGQFANLVALGSTTLQNFTGINATTTNATTTTLAVTGNATSTFANGIALSTGCFAIGSTCLTQGLTSALTSIGPTGQTTTGPAVTIATSTTGTDFTVTGSGSTLTFNLPFASATAHGKLASTDWSIFNNKISSSSLDTSAKLAALLTDETGTAGSVVFSISPNFTGTPTFQGFLSQASTTISALTVTTGTTTNATSTNFFANNASTTNLTFATAIGGTGQFINLLALGSTTLQNFTASNSTSTNATTTGALAVGTNLVATGGLSTFSNTLHTGSTTLQNFTGINATTTQATTTFLAVTGTGTSTFANGIALSTGCFAIGSTCLTQGLTSALTSIGPTGQTTTGPAVTIATSTTGTDFTVTGSGSTLTFNLPFASATAHGKLASTDWSIFNNKISSSSLDTSAKLAALLTDETGTAGSVVFSISPNFTGTPTFQGFLSQASTTISALTVTTGTTTNATSTNFFANNASTTNLTFATAIGGTGQFINLLALGSTTLQNFTASNSTSTNATTTGALAVGTNLVATGGLSTFSNTLHTGSTTLQNFTGINATTTQATTTFLAVTGTGTSTFANGIALSTGCFAIGSTCLTQGLTSALTSIGPTGQTTTGPAVTIATSTTGTDFTVTGSGSTLTFNLPFASATAHGKLASTDWSIFNNKISSSSLDTSAKLAALLTDETGTAGSVVFSISPAFTGTPTFQGFLSQASTTISALTVTTGTTTNATSTNFFANNASTTNLTFATAIGGTGQFINLLALGSTTLQNFTASNSTSTNATTTGALAVGTNLVATGGLSTFSNTLHTGSTTLQNFTGINATTTQATTTFLAVTGTGTSTFANGIALSTGCFAIGSTCLTQGLTSALTSIGPTGQTTTGPAVTIATSTTGTDFTVTGSGSTLTFNLPFASATAHGKLASTDWSIFNNKISSSSLDTSAKLAALLTDETGTAGSVVFSISPNFTGTPTFQGFLSQASTTISALTVTTGTTTNATSTNFFANNASTTNLTFATAIGGTGQFINLLALGSTTLQNFTASNSTSTNATTTGAFAVTGTATSTFTNGIAITGGCFSQNGSCVGSQIAWSGIQDPTSGLNLNMGTNPTSFNWTTGTGANDLYSLTTDANANGLGSLLYLQTGANSTVKPLRVLSGGTEALAVGITGNVGIGTTTPISKLSVSGGAAIGSGIYTAAPSNGLIVQGNVGIGTTSPFATLSIAGTGTLFRATDSANTDVFSMDDGGNISTAGFIDMGGIGGGPSTRLITRLRTILNDETAGITLNATDPSGVIVLQTGSTDRVTVDGNGNVGIGTTSPFGKLAIHAVGGETNSLLLNIASSTAAFATTTLFSVNNVGLVTAKNLLVTGSTTLQNFTGINATTTQATTTFLAVTGTGTSTFANGIALSTGCFAIGSTCLTQGLTSALTSIGPTGQTTTGPAVTIATSTTGTDFTVTGSGSTLTFNLPFASATAHGKLASTDWSIFNNKISSSSLDTSAKLAALLTDETGTAGSVVFSISPNFTGTPTFQGFLSQASTTISALTVTTGTTTNATSTNFFANNASTTNLTFATAIGGTGQFINLLALGSTTLQNFTASNSTSTNATTTGALAVGTNLVATGGLSTFSNTLHTGSTTLQNFTGINATTTQATTTFLAVTGTGTSTFANGIALSTGCFAIGSTCLTQGLTSALTSIGPTGQTTTGPAVTIATSTTGTDFTVTGSGSTLTFNLPFASATAHGKLASTDWSIFNNKISSSSLDTSAKLAALLTDETGTAGSVVFSISPNFTGTPTFQGFLSQASTTISALTVTTGTTTNATSTNFFANNASTTNLTFATAIGGTGQFINLLALGSTTLQNFTASNSTSTNATTTGALAVGTNLVATGGLSTFSNTLHTGSTTLQNFTGINATTTNATTTTLAVTGNATSTFANGIALSTGCFAIGSTCLTQGLTSALTSIGPTGQTTTGPAVTIATSTTGTDFTVTGSGSTLTFNLPFASATAHGKLASTDWSIFNNKISSSSLDTSAKLAALLTDETGTAGSVVFSISPNFTGTPTFQGFLSQASTTISALTVTTGTTTNATSTNFFANNASTTNLTFATAIGGTGQFINLLALGSTTLQNFTASNSTSTNATTTGALAVGTNLVATGGLSTFSNTLHTGSTTLQNFTGINATTTQATTTFLAVTGTGTSTFANGIALSTGCFAIGSTCLTQGLTSALTSIGPTGQTTTGPAVTIATSTTGTDFTVTGSGSTLTFNLPFASATAHGKLASTDWSIFNNKISSSSLDTSAKLAALLTDETGTAGSVVFSISPNFTGTPTFQGFLSQASTTISALTVTTGTTTNATSTNFFANNASTTNLTFATAIGGTGQFINLLALGSTTLQNFTASNSTSTNATTTGALAVGTNLVATGGLSTFSNTLHTGSTTLQNFTGINATTTQATTTFLAVTGTGTSTFANGIALSTGCFAIGSTCLTQGLTSALTSIGPTGQTTTGPAVTIATSTTGTDFTVTGSGSTLTFNLPFASATAHGKLASTDWSIFNNKISSSSLDTSAKLAALLTDETGTAGSVVFSISPNFTGTPTFQGFLSQASTTISALTVTTGTTTNATSTNFFANNASTTNLTFATAIGGTGQFINLLALGSTTLQNFTASNSTSTNATTTGALAVGTNLVATGGLSTFSNTLHTGSTTLQNFTGINATTTQATTTFLAVTGTGTSTFANGIALSTGCFAIGSTCLTQGLTSALTSIGPTGQTTTGPAVTIATSTTGTDFTVTGSGSTLTFNLPFASATAHGKLASTDWSIFNNKISSSSLDTSAKLAALLTDETGTAGSVVFSISPNFTGTPTFQGFLSQASTTISALTVTTGTTTNATSTNFFANNASTTNLTFATAIGGTGQFINLLALGSTTLQNFTASNSTSTNATTTGALAVGTNLVATGGLSTFSNTLHTGSTTLQNFTGINATTTQATTTFLAVTGTGTSTFANGIALSTGCFAIGSTCLTQGLTSALTSIGPTGQTTTGPAVTIATSTTGTDFTVTGSGSTLTFNLPFASATAHGKLASTDWSIFNNKISSSSLDTSAKLAALLTDETGTAGSVVFSISPNFTGTPTFQGFLSQASTTISALTVTTGTTTNATSTNFFANNASTTNLTFATAIGGTGQFINLLALGSTTLQNVTFTNATGTSATTTNFASTNASTTNLVVSSAGGVVGCAQFTITGLLTNAGSPCGTSGGSNTDKWATSTNGLVIYPNSALATVFGGTATTTLGADVEVLGDLFTSGSTTLQNFTAVNSTTTNATTTNFFTSNFVTGALRLSGAGTNMLAAIDGSGNVVSSSTPTVAAIIATSTIATSTFAGAVQVGTSTFPSGLFVVGTSSLGGLFYVDRNSGNIGIGSSSPYSRFSIVNPNLTGVANLLQIDSSLGTPVLSVKNNSNTGLIRIGVGTTTASTEFSVNGSGYFTNAIGVGVANTTAGTLAIDDGTNAVINLNETNDNADLGTIFFKGAGTTRGSITGRNDLTMSSTLNLGPGVNTTMRISANGTTGIGTTSAQFLLTLATTSKPQLALTDSGNLAGNNWVFRNAGGLFALATSTNTINTSATSSVSALTIDANGLVAMANGLLVNGSSTLQRLSAVDATTTNATTTSLAVTSAAGSVGCAQFTITGVLTNTNSACGTGGASTDKFATSTNGLSIYVNSALSTVFGGTATTTLGAEVEVLGDFFTAGSTTLQNFTANNGTTTNATSTNLFATTANFTNLTVTGAATCNSLTQALQTSSTGLVSCGSFLGNVNSAAGWLSSNSLQSVTMATTSFAVAIGATTTQPYAKFSVTSDNTTAGKSTTTMALVGVSGQTANILDIYDNTGKLNSVITAAGALGIGTTSPWAGAISASSTSVTPGIVFDQRGTGALLDLQQGGVDKFTVANNGGLTINVTTSDISKSVSGGNASSSYSATGATFSNVTSSNDMMTLDRGTVPAAGAGTLSAPGATTTFAGIGSGAHVILRSDGQYVIIHGAGLATASLWNGMSSSMTQLTNNPTSGTVSAGAISVIRTDGRYLLINGNGQTTSSIFDPYDRQAAIAGPTLTSCTAATGTNLFLRNDGKYTIFCGGSGNWGVYDPTLNTYTAGTAVAGTFRAGALTVTRDDGTAIVFVGGGVSTHYLYIPNQGATGAMIANPITVNAPTISQGSVAFRRTDGKYLIIPGAVNSSYVYDPSPSATSTNMGVGTTTPQSGAGNGPTVALNDGAQLLWRQDGKYLLITGSSTGATTNIIDPSQPAGVGSTMFTAGPTALDGLWRAGATAFLRPDGTYAILRGGGTTVDLYDMGFVIGGTDTAGADSGIYTSECITGTSLNPNSSLSWNTSNEGYISFFTRTGSNGCSGTYNQVQNSGDNIISTSSDNSIQVKIVFKRAIPDRFDQDFGIRISNTTRYRRNILDPAVYGFTINNNNLYRRTSFELGNAVNSASSSAPLLLNLTNLTTGVGLSFSTYSNPQYLSNPNGTNPGQLNPSVATGTPLLTGIASSSVVIKRPDGKYLILAGSTSTPNAQVYDPLNETITSNGSTFPSVPTSAVGYGAFAFKRPDGKFLIFVGASSTSAGVPTATTTTNIYDPVSNTFAWGPALVGNGGRGAQPILLPNGKVLILNGNFTTNTTIYDPYQNTMIQGPATVNVIGGGAQVIPRPDGTYLIIPGNSTEACALVTATNMFDPNAMAFRANTNTTITTGVGVGDTVIPRTDGTYLIHHGGGLAGCSAPTPERTSIYVPSTNKIVTGPVPPNPPNVGATASLRSEGSFVLPTADGNFLFAQAGATSTNRLAIYIEKTGAAATDLPGTNIGAWIGTATSTASFNTTADANTGKAGSYQSYGNVGPGAITFQRADGKFVVLAGMASSTAPGNQTFLLDAGWNSQGTYRTEEINIPDMDANSVLSWNTIGGYQGITAEVRTASTRDGLQTAVARQIGGPGSKINPAQGDVWLLATFNFKRDFPSYTGIYTDVWYNSDHQSGVTQRTITQPILTGIAVTKDTDFLNLQADGLSMLRISSTGNLYGTVGSTINTSGADLAERYTSREELATGTVVSIDAQNNHGVMKSKFQYQPDLVGVVSTDPGFVTGAYTENSYPIALIGRVPVLVTNENGMIHSGDYITSASVPGYAMKATLAGRVIGKALESMDSAKLVDCPASDIVIAGRKCTSIMVFVNLIDYAGDSVDVAMSDWNTMRPDLSTNPVQGLDVATSSIGTGLVSAIDGQVITVGRNISQRDSSVLGFLETLKTYRENTQNYQSEIFADKIAAVSQVISPNVVTNLLNARDVEGLRLQVAEAKIGRLQVDSIIGGFVIRKAGLASAVSALDASTTVATSTATSTPEENATSTASTTLFALPGDIVVKIDTEGNAFFAGEILANSVKTNALSVAGSATFSGGLIVNQIGKASSTLDILSDATFFGRPYFTSDTGGTAIVKKGSRKVAVTFDTEYLASPIVSATISLDSSTTTDTKAIESMIFEKGIQYIVTERTTKGFTILLNKAVDEDVTMSWIALAIKDAKISLSTEFETVSTATSTPSTPTTTPSIVDTGSTGGAGNTSTTTATSTSPVVVTPPAPPATSTPPVADSSTTTPSTEPAPIVSTNTGTAGDTSAQNSSSGTDTTNTPAQ